MLSRGRYDDKVRDLVVDRILKDGMNVEQTMESLRREFLLDLSTGFIYDVLRDRVVFSEECRNTSINPSHVHERESGDGHREHTRKFLEPLFDPFSAVECGFVEQEGAPNAGDTS